MTADDGLDDGPTAGDRVTEGTQAGQAGSDSDVDLVLRAYEAFARGDIEQAVASLHPDVEWVEPEEFPGGGRHRGPAAVADYLRGSRAMWAELVSEPTAHRRGDKIVVIHRVHGRLADGTPHDATVADVFTVEDGRVVAMTAYADPSQALAAVS
jgi:ketosteroid isomerase-like protein